MTDAEQHLDRTGRYSIVSGGEGALASLVARAKKHGYRDFYIYWGESGDKRDMRFELTDGQGRHLAWSRVPGEAFLTGEPVEFNWEASDLLCLI